MYDIIFISYDEENADDNYARLKKRFPIAKRVHGVKGIQEAHREAALKALTNKFWVVDGDAHIVSDFNFSFECIDPINNPVYVWRSTNLINNLEYGNGGVKLLPRQKVLGLPPVEMDFATKIADVFYPMSDVSNYNCFNSSPFSAWRAAFRECVKLASKSIVGQVDNETEQRLHVWKTEAGAGVGARNGEMCIAGAIAGEQYALDNINNGRALSKINNYDWLKEKFNELS
jgi:hypothetical protein